MSTIIDRVRALIAKAESSPYPAEADAFMAKAQKLINEHAIDTAGLRGESATSVAHETVPMTGSYSKERALVWSAVANANRCQLLTLSGYGSSKVIDMTLVGRDQDRQLVRLLATSLELQAMRRLGELDVDRRFESPVVQRRSFLRGFALEVADRLNRAGHDRVIVSDRVEKALVLAAGAVTRYIDDNFDVSRGRRSQGRHDGMAYSQGRRAGASADVGATRLDGRSRALPPGH